MKVVLYGATGKSGSRILTELVSRGHTVVGVARNTTSLPAGIEAVQDDLSNVAKIAAVTQGADAVVSAYAPPMDDTDQIVDVTERQIAALSYPGSPRLVVVGGAGSLEVAPGVTLLASGHLPQEWVPIATSGSKSLDLLRTSSVDWTYFSPAAFFEPGERTGKFRLGTDTLIADEQHNSRISLEDYAIALVDELEKPAHRKARFTIGY
jgi:putative NADH-flavin reductase